MSYQLTKKEITKEIVKSGKDPVYFINTYTKISHPVRGLVPFKTYDYQASLLEGFVDYRFNVILKARQLGISTIVAAYIVWLMLFYRDKNILVMATKFGTAANLVKKVKAMIKQLPPWVRIAEISVDNRTSFELSNGSQIKASTTSVDAGRSEALSLLVIDEAAHVDGLDEIWTALYPTLSTGGDCIALSSPNGVGNWFYKAYTDATSGNNDFFPTILPWEVHPDRDDEWFEKETKNMSRRQIAQELECNFNTSGETVLHPDDIAWMTTTTKEPKYKTGFDRNLWIWEEYQQDSSYLLSADVARGDGEDYSTFHIIKLETMEQVAEYRGKITPDLFANIVNTTAREYGNCMAVIENATVGFTVLDKLVEMEYPNLYYSTKGSHEYLDQYEADLVSNSIAGFTTSTKTKPLIIAKLEEFIRNKHLNIYSSRFVSEAKTFIWYNGKAKAMRGYNDDLMMSMAIACWVKDTVLTVNQRELQYKKAFLDSIIVTNTNFDTRIAGMIGYDKTNKYMDENTKEDIKPFKWLYKG
jgi:hypothetical protein